MCAEISQHIELLVYDNIPRQVMDCDGLSNQSQHVEIELEQVIHICVRYMWQKNLHTCPSRT